MAWTPQDSQSKPGSAVLDMDLEEMEILDDNGGSVASSSQGGKGKGSMMDDMRQRMWEQGGQMFFQAGTQGAKKAWGLYGNIDILRPYFDVEPKEVQMRLLYSLIPFKTSNEEQLKMPKELYGPSMLVLTLIALLLYQMKTADHRVEEGTLIGSAFATCFMYWFAASSTVWFVAYISNVRVAALQVLSMIGYALFGHCIVLFLGTVIHTAHDHLFFYLLWVFIGGLSTMRMASLMMSRTHGQKERLVIIGTIAALHLLFLLYLHFAYHTIVEEISDALNEPLIPVRATLSPDALPKNVGDVKKIPVIHDGEKKGFVTHGVIDAVKDVAKRTVNGTFVEKATKKLQDSLILGGLRSNKA